MLIVAGKFIVPAERRELFLEDWKQRIAAVRQADGCLELALSPDLVDDRVVRLFERWESRAHHDRHVEGLISEGQQPTVAREVVLYEVASSEPSPF